MVVRINAKPPIRVVIRAGNPDLMSLPHRKVVPMLRKLKVCPWFSYNTTTAYVHPDAVNEGGYTGYPIAWFTRDDAESQMAEFDKEFGTTHGWVDETLYAGASAGFTAESISPEMVETPDGMLALYRLEGGWIERQS